MFKNNEKECKNRNTKELPISTGVLNYCLQNFFLFPKYIDFCEIAYSIIH